MPAKTPTEEVSKNTKDIVAILNKMFLNSSDETEEKKDINKKEKENVKKDEVNLLTWGMLGRRFTNSISKWSKERMEQTGFISRTLKITTAIWTGFTDTFLKYFKNVYSKLTSHLREVLGPVAEMFDATVDFLKGTWSFGKKLYDAAFGKNPEDKFRNKLLMQIRDYWHDTFKKNAREDKDQKKKPNKLIAGLLLGLGIVVGAIVATILAPFRLLLLALKKVKPIALAINHFFGEGSKFGLMIKGLGTKFKTLTLPITTFFSKFKLFGKLLSFFGRYLTPLTTGLKIGFKVLGWPLTILLGVIDFVKGFFKTYTSDNLGEALTAGLKSAFMGLFDGFVGLFTWLTGKILGWGPEKTAKVYDKIIKTISDVFDSIFKWVGDLTAGIKKMFTKDYWKDMWKKVKEGPPDTVVRPADTGNTLSDYNNQIVKKRTEANGSTKKDNKELISQFEKNKQALMDMNRLLNEQNKNTGETLQQIIQSNNIKNEPAPQIREDLGPAAFGIAIENEDFG